MKNIAIVLAGGNGSRMQSSIPKQFLLINGLPVLMHTLQAFFNSGATPEIILVIALAEQASWKALCSKYEFTLPHQLVSGGKDRFHSVQNALDFINSNYAAMQGSGHEKSVQLVVGIHDGVRPLVSAGLIERLYNRAAESGNAIPVLECRESIRKLEGTESRVVNRAEYRMVQTPQCFRFDQIYHAFKNAGDGEFTDDASVAEHAGIKMQLVEGENRNIKITYPEDLLLAAALL